jgi:hypothetical protein
MSIRVLALALILGLGLASPAAAEDGEDFGRTGGYAGAGFAVGIDNIDGVSASTLDTGVGFDAWGGYRFARHFAAELEIQYIDRLNLGALDANALAFTGNLKAYLCDCRFQPFLLAGIGVTRVAVDVAGLGLSGSEAAFGARLGGGFDVYLNENWSLGSTASYVLSTGDLSVIDWVSVVFGAQYRF